MSDLREKMIELYKQMYHSPVSAHIGFIDSILALPEIAEIQERLGIAGRFYRPKFRQLRDELNAKEAEVEQLKRDLAFQQADRECHVQDHLALNEMMNKNDDLHFEIERLKRQVEIAREALIAIDNTSDSFLPSDALKRMEEE